MGGGYYDRDVISSEGGGAGNDVVGKVNQLNKGLDPKSYIDEDSRIVSENLNPIVFALDVTGSMGEWPKIIYDKMPMFYGQIMMKNYLPDPSISFCAIGDAYHDQAPLQVTPFGQGKEIDEMIAKLWLEGGGGPGYEQSYEFSAYFYNHYVGARNKQMGFFFVTGDEAFYDEPDPKKYLQALGEQPKKVVNANRQWAEIRQKYNVFLLKKEYNSTYEDQIYKQWVGALGGHERILRTKTPKACIDIILGAIALTSGARTLPEYVADMKERGQDEGRIKEVEEALERYAKALSSKKIIPVGVKTSDGIPIAPEKYREELKAMVALEDEKDHLTQSYYCPLTKELFVDPVSTCDGYTYERHAIEEWLKTNDVSPATKEKLENKNLIPNPVVQKHVLDHYKKYLTRKENKASKVAAVEPASEVEKPKVQAKFEEVEKPKSEEPPKSEEAPKPEAPPKPEQVHKPEEAPKAP